MRIKPDSNINTRFSWRSFLITEQRTAVGNDDDFISKTTHNINWKGKKHIVLSAELRIGHLHEYCRRGSIYRPHCVLAGVSFSQSIYRVGVRVCVQELLCVCLINFCQTAVILIETGWPLVVQHRIDSRPKSKPYSLHTSFYKYTHWNTACIIKNAK